MGLTYHRVLGHPVAVDHPDAVSKWGVDEAIRPRTDAQLPAMRASRAWIDIEIVQVENHDFGDEDVSR